MKKWKSKPAWTIDPNPAELTAYNPPDILLSDLDTAGFKDLNGRVFVGTRRPLIYKIPWYLSPLYFWYGLKHWFRHKEWPSRILYFPKHLKRDFKIYLDVHEHPQDFLSY